MFVRIDRWCTALCCTALYRVALRCEWYIGAATKRVITRSLWPTRSASGGRKSFVFFLNFCSKSRLPHSIIGKVTVTPVDEPLLGYTS